LSHLATKPENKNNCATVPKKAQHSSWLVVGVCDYLKFFTMH